MGIISGYALSGVLAASVVAGAVGFSFTGTETVDTVKTQLVELKNKVLQYETAEVSLFDKIGLIKGDATTKLTDANGKIVSAKNQINTLEAEKSYLEKTISDLNIEVAGLKADKERLTSDLGTANAKITELEGIIIDKNIVIGNLNDQLTTLQALYDTLLLNYNNLVLENDANKSEAERANAEVKVANDKVAELAVTSIEVAEVTTDKTPMTQAELDAIGTVNQPNVFDAELVVQNLGLTYIQDGQSADFKAAHPDLVINEGDRVWRVNNSNAFSVYVEYVKGSEAGELVANPSQTYYLTETGGTMIIKWQDENGVWKQTVKAGA